MTTEISKYLLHSIPRKLYAIALGTQLPEEDSEEDEDISPPEQVISSNVHGLWHLERDHGWIIFDVAVPPYDKNETVQVKLSWSGELVFNEESKTQEFIVHDVKSSCDLLYDAVNNLQFFVDCETSIYSLFS